MSIWVFLFSWASGEFIPPDPRLYEFHDAKVEQTAPFKYWLTLPDGTRVHALVCDDYVHPPMFSTGMTLARVIFADFGKCWSVNPNYHAGYFILRNEKGVIIYDGQGQEAASAD